MKHSLFIFFFFIFFTACHTQPKNFTYSYEKKNTGLDQLIHLNGYYISEHACDSSFYSIYKFSPDGLFYIATTSQLTNELIQCFNNDNNNLCKYVLKGIYILDGNIIKTQVIWPVGNRCTIFRNYRILPCGNIINMSDYVQAEHSNLAYMRNYPSFYKNPCEKIALFIPLKNEKSLNYLK
jgi:hypothetical protein